MASATLPYLSIVLVLGGSSPSIPLHPPKAHNLRIAHSASRCDSTAAWPPPPTLYSLKSHNFNNFCDFICPIQKNVEYLRSQFHAGDVCMSSAGVADIFKRRLLTLCSGVFETSQLSKASSGLSNDRCPTGYRLSLLCQSWYATCAYAYAHACTLIT